MSDKQYADFAASASVPTEESLADDTVIFKGGATNVSLIATTTTTTT